MKELVYCGNCEKEFNKNNTIATLQRHTKDIRFCSQKCVDQYLKGDVFE